MTLRSFSLLPGLFLLLALGVGGGTQALASWPCSNAFLTQKDFSVELAKWERAFRKIDQKPSMDALPDALVELTLISIAGSRGALKRLSELAADPRTEVQRTIGQILAHYGELQALYQSGDALGSMSRLFSNASGRLLEQIAQGDLAPNRLSWVADFLDGPWRVARALSGRLPMVENESSRLAAHNLNGKVIALTKLVTHLKMAKGSGRLEDSAFRDAILVQIEKLTGRSQGSPLLSDQLQVALAPHVLEIALHRIQLETSVSEYLVIQDAARIEPLRLILEELVANGIKYRDPSKPVSKITLIFERGTLIYEDNGLGIPAPSRLFEPGVRQHPDAASGTGMGLSSIRKILEEMGGSIEHDADLRNGTRFRIRLPESIVSLGVGA